MHKRAGRFTSIQSHFTIAVQEKTLANMKLYLACLLVFIAVAYAKPAERKTYTSKYDNVDVDRILNNDRILANYVKCLLDEGPCTAEGRELKKTLPDALATECSKCNERQKTTADKIIRHMINKKAKDWERLAKKYDPKGEYQKKYDTQLKSVTA